MNTMHEYQEQTAKKITDVEILRAQNPQLIAGSDRVTAAKNIRIELKRAFPGVKFSVTGESFSGGDAISISWIDGPTKNDVKEISGKYQAGSFDGMTDYYNYDHDAWNDSFGSAKYITTSRKYSPELVGMTIASIGAKWHDGVLPSADDYRKGRLFYTNPDRRCDSWQTMIYRTIEGVLQ